MDAWTKALRDIHNGSIAAAKAGMTREDVKAVVDAAFDSYTRQAVAQVYGKNTDEGSK